MRKNRRKRKYIIITLTLIVFLMSVGYSAFQTNLKIKGTTRITGVWDVRITNVTAGTPTGSAENAAAPTWDNLTASMKAKLNKKGDAMEYDVTISNRGTVDAKLGEIIKENKSTNEAIKITFSNYIKGQRLSAGESTIVKVKIEYDSSYKGIVDYSTPAKAEVSFNYVQGEGSSTNPNNPAPTTHLITYNYEENGGTSSNAEVEYLNENTEFDLTTITATKEGWTFVGWNTNKNATTGLNNITITNDINLYAIFKKEVTVTYTKNNEIQSIGKQQDNCTRYNNDATCDIILPSITSNEIDKKTAWYDGTNKIGKANGTFAASENITLQARNVPPAMIKSWEQYPETDFHNTDYRSNIISVEILDNVNIPAAATNSWNVTEEGYDEVLAWVIPDTNDSTKYHLYIGGEDGVIANPDSSNLFYQFTGLQTADLSDFDTSNVTNMSRMFYCCYNLITLDLSSFNTSNVTNMSYMFSNCESLTTLDLSSFNTSNVTDMSRMFYYCSNLRTIYASDNFVTSSVTSSSNMFRYDSNLFGGYGTSYNSSNYTHTMAKLDKEGQAGYFTDKNDNLRSIPMLRSWTSSATTDFHSSTYKTKIISVETVTNINVPANATESWDVSAWGNNSVKAWVIPDTNDSTKYHLYIGGEDGVIANSNSSYLFNRFSGLKTADLTHFNTSNVTNMSSMFSNCTSLTDLDLSSFNTLNVTDMSNMFQSCSSLTDLDLSSFNTSNVKYMGSMFQSCSSLRTIYASNNFVTTAVISGSSMFYSDNNLIGGYGTIYTTSNSSHGMAKIDKTGQAGYFTDKNDNLKSVPILKSWTSGVTTDFHSNIYKSNIISVETVTNTNVPSSATESWDVSLWHNNIVKAWVIPDTNDSTKYHLYIGGEDGVIANTNSSYLFYNFTGLKTADLTHLNTSNVTNMGNMFEGCSSLTDLDLSSFNTSNVKYMNSMFQSCSNLRTIYASNNFVTTAVTNSANMFYSDNNLVGGYGTTYKSSNTSHEMAKIDKTGQTGYFTDKNDNLKSVPILKSWTSGATTDFHSNTYKPNIISVEIVTNTNVPLNATESWDVSRYGGNSVLAWVIPDTNDSTKYHLYIGGEDGVIANPDSSNLFYNFTGLKTADLSNFDTSNVTNMTAMFRGCSSIITLNLSSFNTSNVTDMSYMFNDCSSLTSLDLSSFNTENVTNMTGMFQGCSSLTTLDISSFNTSSVKSMISMFYYCTSLKTIYVSDNFVTTAVNNSTNMFSNDENLIGGYGTTYDSSNITHEMAKIDKTGQTGYFTDKNDNLKSRPVLRVWTEGATEDFHSSTYKSNIMSVEIVTNTNVPSNATESWDVSLWDNNSVKAWVIPDTNDNTKYHLYMGGDGGIIANPKSSYLFYDFTGLKTADLTHLDTSNVKNMYAMFRGCSNLTALDLSNFDTTNVKIMTYMFQGCSSLTTLDLSSFNTTNVINMSFMFQGCSNLRIIYASDNFVTTAVASSTNMFSSDTNLVGGNGTIFKSSNITHEMAKIDKTGQTGYFTDKNDNLRSRPVLRSWNTGAAEDFHSSTYKSNIMSVEIVTNTNVPSNATESWDVSAWGNNSVKAWVIPDTNDNTKYHLYMGGDGGIIANPNSSYLFSNFSELKTADLTNLNTINVTNMGYMFYYCSKLTSLDLSRFNTSNVIGMNNMFSNCSKLTSLNLSSFNTSKVTDMSNMFQGCSGLTSLDLSNFNTINVTNMYAMFRELRLTYLDLSSFNTSNVTNMGCMFYDCRNLTDLDLSNFNTSKVTDMSYMFNDCSSLTSLDLSSFNTSNVTNMGVMFQSCDNLTTLDLSSFNTSNVTDMHYMFNECPNLTDIDLSSFNTSKVTDMSNMFQGCSSLTSLDLLNFNTTNVTSMSVMFRNCSNLTTLDLSSFNTTNVKTMTSMFHAMSGIKTIYASDNFVTTAVTSSNNMFSSDTNLVGGNGTIFNSSNITHEMAKIDKEGQVGYFTDSRYKISATRTSNSITLTAPTTLSYGSVTKFEFSKDGGTTFIDNGSTNTYTFNGLTKNTKYSIVVRYTVSGNTYTSAIDVTTKNIATPTFTQTSPTSTSSDVTIKYPKECGTTLTCTYQKNNEAPVTVTTKTIVVNYTANGELIAQVTDGTNTVSSTFTVVVGN